MSLMQLSMIFVMVTMAEESARRICEVLQAEPTIANPAEPVREMADGSIDFDHVSFSPRTPSARPSMTSTCTSPAARPSASSAVPARQNLRW